MIKYAFFDFDDTLCVHKKHFTQEEFHKKALGLCIQQDSSYYLNECAPPKQMLALIEELTGYGATCYCLTQASHSGWVKPKMGFVTEMYNGLIEDTIATSTREGKIEYIQEFAEARGCNLDEILLVEDHPTTIGMAIEAGIAVMSAMEVMIKYE